MRFVHTVKVRGRDAEIDDCRIVQGGVGSDFISLDLDRGWAELETSLVLSGGAGSYSPVASEDGLFEFPWELARDAGTVGVQVVGRLGGKVFRHTVPAEAFHVVESGEADGAAPSDPTLTEYRKALQDCEEASVGASELRQELEHARDAGEFDGERGPVGPSGEKGEKGDKLSFSDLSAEDVSELQRPAREAAEALGSLSVVDGALCITYLEE